MSRTTRDNPIAPLRDPMELAIQQIDDALTRRQQLTDRFQEETEKEITIPERMLDSRAAHLTHGDQDLPYEQFRHSLHRVIIARTKDGRAELLRDSSDRLRMLERRVGLAREVPALSVARDSDAD